MPKLERVRIDSRGRIVLPQHFRETLGLKENDTAYAVLDEAGGRMWVSPAAEESLAYLEIRLDDAPGSLARAAAALEKAGVDLVATESHSTLRGKAAIWRITARSTLPIAELKKRLAKAGLDVAAVRKA